MKDEELLKLILKHGCWITMDDGNSYCIDIPSSGTTEREALQGALESFQDEAEERRGKKLDATDEPEEIIHATKEEMDACDNEWEYESEFNAGKEFAQKKIGELLDEVETAYRELARAEKMDSEASRIPKAQLNAIKFAKSWVASGGHTDLDGNRACLPW